MGQSLGHVLLEQEPRDETVAEAVGQLLDGRPDPGIAADQVARARARRRQRVLDRTDDGLDRRSLGRAGGGGLPQRVQARAVALLCLLRKRVGDRLRLPVCRA